MAKLPLALLSLAAASFAATIVSPPGASPLERLAAREVRRYFYLRTGQLLPIVTANRLPAGDTIVVARKDRPLVSPFTAALAPQQYVLKTAGSSLLIAGGDDAGTLYGAYRFAERMGVRFYLHGDVVPDAIIPPALPQLDEAGKPLFDIRGIQPFHDFPEGPDWWNQDDYLSYIAQLPKMRMNFIGLHCYPEGNVGPEPAVWIGEARDQDRRGMVKFSYPSQWANTARPGHWGYAAMKTSGFCCGAQLLFEDDDFGPDVMRARMPSPATPAQSNQLFNDTGRMFRVSFAAAKSLAVKTCIGTETPLTIPKLVQDRLRSQGKDPKDPAVVRALYEGIFRRIASLYPVDYYWLWTPENWTWSGNKPEQLEATLKDIQAALDALTAIGKPFTLATSGWVLGPQSDRAALDKFLPKDSPMSCINRQVGHAPDEPGFANVTGRPKWVIPWMENDPNLTAPQPWAARMRYDAADARRLGCTGLLGIHWRTKILAANVAALAAAAWDQSWAPADFATQPIPPLPVTLKGNDNPLRGRAMPIEDFYIDFARASFGDAVAEEAGRVLASVDGVNLPEPATWQKGPGGIKPEKAPWEQIRPRYAFVDALAALRPKVQGPGNLERFDYWLNTYRYMAAMAEASCLRGQLDQAMADHDARHALALRTELAEVWGKMISLAVSAADTPGELGTLANLEQHNRQQLKFLAIHDDALAQALASPLPPSVQPPQTYAGPARIIVPTVRTLVKKGEALTLKVIALDQHPVKSVTLFWRPLGPGAFRQLDARHIARAVYKVVLPPARTDLEYYLRAETASGKDLLWPPTAPSLNQTVVER